MAKDPIKTVAEHVRHYTEVNNPKDGKAKYVASKSKLHVEVSMKYGEIKPSELIPKVVDKSEWINNSSVQDTQVFTVDKTTTDSFTWTIKEGIKVGAKFDAKIPFVGDAEASVEINLEATQAGTHSEQKKWSYSANIPVPPHKKIITEFLVNEATYSIPFTAVAKVRGTIFIQFDKKECKYTIDELIIDDGWTPSGFEVKTTGTLAAVMGEYFVVKVNEFDPSEMVDALVKTYVFATGL